MRQRRRSTWKAAKSREEETLLQRGDVLGEARFLVRRVVAVNDPLCGKLIKKLHDLLQGRCCFILFLRPTHALDRSFHLRHVCPVPHTVPYCLARLPLC